MSLHICELCVCVLHLKCRWIVPSNPVRYKIKHMLHWVEARAFFTLKERVLNEFLLETFMKPWIRGSRNKQKGVGIFNHFCITVIILTLPLSCQILWVSSLLLEHTLWWGRAPHWNECCQLNVQAQLHSRLQIPGGHHQQPSSKAKDNCIRKRLVQGWWCGKLF